MGNAQRTSLRPLQAAEFLGVSKSTLWCWARERKDFPKPRKLSSRCTVFDAAELLAWRDFQMSGDGKSMPLSAPVTDAVMAGARTSGANRPAMAQVVGR